MGMNVLACDLINWPVVIFTIMANVFFIFCMICPLHGERIKQPLKLLLASLICCTVTNLTSALILVFAELESSNLYFMLPLHMVFFGSFCTNMSSSVWLNFFYCTQIVPAQRALFVWIKKNIKTIIFCIWLAEGIYNLFESGVMVFNYLTLGCFFNDLSYNFTVCDSTYLQTHVTESQIIIFSIAVCLVRARFIFCLCVMVMSSGSTVVYLSRHMRRMVANGQPLSGPQLSSQVRVTVTGILQGVLYTFCALWTMYKFFSSQSFFDPCVYFTIVNLYMSGTTFNLGAGQAVFRQRAAEICLRAARCRKKPQVQESEQRG